MVTVYGLNEVKATYSEETAQTIDKNFKIVEKQYIRACSYKINVVRKDDIQRRPC